MSRTTLAADRVAALIVGVLAIALGATAIVWWTGQWSGLTGKIDSAPVLDVVDEPWWPWVAALTGLALVLIGLRWLFAHLRRQSVRRLTLEGSTKSGRLTAQAGPVAKAAGDALGDVRGVRSSKATLTHDRGQIVARFTATIDPDADLSLIASAADRVSAELRQVLGRDDIVCRVQLKVSSRSTTLSRVA